MLMKKLSEDHYIIMDDSEIKKGDWYYLPRTNSVYQCKEDPTELNLERRWGVAKITHSTQPLDKSLFFTDRVWSCERLSLGEVKELIGVVDVEKNMWYERNLQNPYPSDSPSNTGFNKGFELGYNQALEDNKEKMYTEEDMRKAMFLYSAWITGGASSLRIAETAEERIKQIIQSLEPKTEWEVEIVNNKLKLKS